MSFSINASNKAESSEKWFCCWSCTILLVGLLTLITIKSFIFFIWDPWMWSWYGVLWSWILSFLLDMFNFFVTYISVIVFVRCIALSWYSIKSVKKIQTIITLVNCILWEFFQRFQKPISKNITNSLNDLTLFCSSVTWRMISAQLIAKWQNKISFFSLLRIA